MDWDRGTPTVEVARVVVTPVCSGEGEAGAFESPDRLVTGQRRRQGIRRLRW
jgi:hypothetical protein